VPSLRAEQKRQRTAGLHDAGARFKVLETPPGFGVRLFSAAFDELPELAPEKQKKMRWVGACYKQETPGGVTTVNLSVLVPNQIQKSLSAASPFLCPTRLNDKLYW